MLLKATLPLQGISLPLVWRFCSDREAHNLGPSGEQVTELDGSGVWQHTNVYANGQLIATYDQEGTQQLLHFHGSDPLGTRRVRPPRQEP